MNNAIQTYLDQTKLLVDGFNISNHFAKEIQLAGDLHISNDNARFFRITELSSQEQYHLRQDLENVLASMKNPNFSWVYYLSGTKKSGIEIYIGLVLNHDLKPNPILSQSKLLKNQLIGNINGVQLDELKAQGLQEHILKPLQTAKHFGLVTGVPSLTIDPQAHSQGESITQGLDRLATTLSGEDWQMIIVAKPEEIASVEQKIKQLLQYSTNLHPLIKQSLQNGENKGTSTTKTTGTSDSKSYTEQEGYNYSESQSEGKNNGRSRGNSKGTSSGESNSGENWSVNAGINKGSSWGTNTNFSITEGDNRSKSIGQTAGTSDSHSEGENTGSSESQSIELLNTQLERIDTHINEKQLERFELGLGKGLFQTAVYLSAPDIETYDRLSLAIMSIFQGNQMLFTPLQVHKISLKDNNVHQLFGIHQIQSQRPHQATYGLIHSIPADDQQLGCATLLNASELSLFAGLPSREVFGIRLRKNIDFAVNTHKINEQDDFELGKIIQNGRELPYANLYLNKKLLNQHIFISGVTGAGKTTTCQQILLQSNLPFLVIEPAKTEYRSLYQQDKSIKYYTVNNENISPFRFNPFELLPNEQLAGHIDMLKATFAAVFPMEASMPYLIEEAIVRSYELKGWDISTSTNFFYDEPHKNPEQCFPIMSELLDVLKSVIKSKNFGQELQEKYEGSLISRLDNLTVGTKGRMLNTRSSINVEALLDEKIVIELDDLKDEKDKALLMGLLIGRVAEAVKQRHKKQPNFQHITLIEEAHRLLEKPDGNDDAKKLGVNLFTNLLAEVRKYGECLIIADQIPNKLTPEILKNTNTKIIHRLFARDDREVIGETIGLTDEQKQFLPMLKAGEAVVYSAGWHEAVRTKVNQKSDTTAPEIDENIIAKASQARIFAERHRLYPKLSQLVQTTDPHEFHELVQKGLLVLNMWIRWYQQTQLDENVQQKWSKPQIEQFIQRLKQDMAQFCTTWQQATDVQPLQALACLFEDVAPIGHIKIESSEYSLQDYLLALFQLAERDCLHEKIVNDELFDPTKSGRIITPALQRLFLQIKTI